MSLIYILKTALFLMIASRPQIIRMCTKSIPMCFILSESALKLQCVSKVCVCFCQLLFHSKDKHAPSMRLEDNYSSARL